MTKQLVGYLAINGLKRLRFCEDLANWKSATNVLHTLDHVHVCVNAGGGKKDGFKSML